MPSYTVMLFTGCVACVLAESSRAGAESGPPRLQNSLGAQFVHVDGGKFWMGSLLSKEEIETRLGREGLAREYPAHEVEISSFYLATSEVTLAQFRDFVQDTGYRTTAEQGGAESSCVSPPFDQAPSHPVVCVSYQDAIAFAEWLSARDGRKYRLPTEAEWEYACRAGSTTVFPWGDVVPQGPAANLAGVEDGFRETAPVGSFPPNAWGLHDMIGNVWEWCADCYRADYYEQSPGVDPRGAADGPMRAYRGASYMDDYWLARSAFRNAHPPEKFFPNSGFRLAMAAPTAVPDDWETITVTLKQGLHGYYGCTDTWLREHLPDTNYGGAEHFHCRHSDLSPILLRYDLSHLPPSTRVVSAEVELYNEYVGWELPGMHAEGPVTIRLCNERWVEGGALSEWDDVDGATVRTSDGAASWTRAPGAPGESVLALCATKGNAGRWYAWDIPPIVVENWISARVPNHGFAVTVGDGWPNKSLAFASSERLDARYRPRLELELRMSPDVVSSYQEQTRAMKGVADERERAQREEYRVHLARLQERERADAEQRRAAERAQWEKEQRPKWAGILGRPLAAMAQVGEDVVLQGIRWRVLDARSLGSQLRGPFGHYKTTPGCFVRVDMEVENQTQAPVTLLARDLWDAQGRRYETMSDATLYFEENTVLLLERINPDVPLRFVQVYEVANGATDFVIGVSNLRLLGRQEAAIWLGL